MFKKIAIIKNAREFVSASGEAEAAWNKDIGISARRNKIHFPQGAICMDLYNIKIQNPRFTIRAKYNNIIGEAENKLPINIPIDCGIYGIGV